MRPPLANLNAPKLAQYTSELRSGHLFKIPFSLVLSSPFDTWLAAASRARRQDTQAQHLRIQRSLRAATVTLRADSPLATIVRLPLASQPDERVSWGLLEAKGVSWTGGTDDNNDNINRTFCPRHRDRSHLSVVDVVPSRLGSNDSAFDGGLRI